MNMPENEKTWVKIVKRVGFLLLSFASYAVVAYFLADFVNQILISRSVDIVKYDNWGTPHLMTFLAIFYIVTKSYLFSYRNHKHWLGLFSLPLFSTFSQMLWVGVGIYFSLQSANLLAWWVSAPNAVPISTTDLELALFLLLSSSFLFLENQLSSNAIHAHLSHESKSKVEQLEHVIRLAPPGDFSSLFALYVDTVNGWTYNKLPLKQKELDKRYNDYKKGNPNNIGILEEIVTDYEKFLTDQKSYIRAVLICFARLAAVFDNVKLGEGSTIYRANIMIKKTKEMVDTKSNVNFLPSIVRDSHIHSVNYYLSLDKDYSVKIYSRSTSITDKEGVLKDFNHDDIDSLILPVFSSKNDELYNCFGAPRAVATGQPQFVTDTHEEVKEWAKLNPGKQVIDAAENYYLNSKKARSLLSIPMIVSKLASDATQPDKIFGSINIYRNTADLLSGDEGKKEQFVNILTPITQALSRIIGLHLSAEQRFLTLEKELQSESQKAA
ncbi:hypothetical protein [Vibrio vulnificus]|uniref:hypothetical protein n=4 Tax=Vibrio TaxID=662 RepID=UPI00187D1EEF|nr:hypothetical protein [Vibrio vulnificus]